MARTQGRQTIDASDNPAVLGMARHRNNGRHNGRGREWETPSEVFQPLDAEFRFTLDPCATEQNAKCLRFFTERTNGLLQSWGGERVFMNPHTDAKYTRGRERHATPGRLSSLACYRRQPILRGGMKTVVGHAAEIRYLRGRVRFLTGGPYRASGFFPSVIVVWSRR